VKIFQGIIYWLFACCVPVLLFTGTIRGEVNAISVYEYGFDKYDISQATGIDGLQLRSVAKRLIDYFDMRVDTPQMVVVREGEESRLFNERELIHLQDVRNLIQLDYRVQIGALFLIIIFALILFFVFRVRWMLLKGLFWGGLITAGLMIVLAIWSFVGFQQFFILFHLISFSNEFWMLDPARDYLIRLFPEGFFFDAAVFGFGAIIVEALIVIGATLGTLKLATGKKKTNPPNRGF
jgi:integral membrane protein (TIGR01906 family)